MPRVFTVLPNPDRRVRISGAIVAMAAMLSACDEAALHDTGPKAEPMAAALEISEADPGGPFAGARMAPKLRPVAQKARAGVVTAGDIDDTLNLAAFRRYANRARRENDLPVVAMGKPLLLRLTATDGANQATVAAPWVRYTLRRPGADTAFHSGYSGVDGTISVFPAMLGHSGGGPVEVRAFASDRSSPVVARLRTGAPRRDVTVPVVSGKGPDFLDLAFVVDTTGSMADELRWLTTELRGIVTSLRRKFPEIDMRFGLIVYRDKGDAYVIRDLGFTKKVSSIVAALKAQTAEGGGDYPEAAAAALQAATRMQWRRGRGARLLFHIADAPPHAKDRTAFIGAATTLAKSNVRIFALGASGVAQDAEYMMRHAALTGGGRYLFLTDDSGVGNRHAEPMISCYRVTALRDLIARILTSELSGRRVEAARSAIIREVGTYANGRCRN